MNAIARAQRPLDRAEWQDALEQYLEMNPPGKRILLMPPDHSRSHSRAGEIVSYLYRRLREEHDVKVMPAVGTHMQMTEEEKRCFFPNVPMEAFLEHHWLTDCETLGVFSSEEVCEITGGLYRNEIPIQINRMVAGSFFDTLYSIGQVVPHEVVGFANYTKNMLVGLGGSGMINHSHMIGALHGVEKTLGCIDTPIRALFDRAQEQYLDRLGITFFLTVVGPEEGINGLYIGKKRDAFQAAAELSRSLNLIRLEKPAERIVAYLDPKSFHTTWIGNKAIYRTRKAVANGGEILVIAPGVRGFGESDKVDACIRKFGYCGSEKIGALYKSGCFNGLEMVAAHLMHSSSEGRFRIVYATDPTLLSPAEVEAAGFDWMDVNQAIRKFAPEHRETGWQDEGYYFVRNPALGLWTV